MGTLNGEKECLFPSVMRLVGSSENETRVAELKSPGGGELCLFTFMATEEQPLIVLSKLAADAFCQSSNDGETVKGF